MSAVVPFNPSQSMQALVPRSISEAVTLAETIAKASLVPEHLRNKPGDCLLIVMQAQRWGMDALSVAQCTSVVRGKLCYEGKLVAAALYSMGAVDGRLEYEYAGNGEQRSIVVSGRPRGSDKVQSVKGTVEQWKTDNGNWKKDPDSMLAYRGTRQWARRYAPEALLGVYTPDEIEDEPITVTQKPAIEMPRAKSQAQQPVDAEFTDTPAQGSATTGSPAQGEPSPGDRNDDEPGPLSDLTPSQCRLVRAKASARGMATDAEILERFPDLSKATINDVLDALKAA